MLMKNLKEKENNSFLELDTHLLKEANILSLSADNGACLFLQVDNATLPKDTAVNVSL